MTLLLLLETMVPDENKLKLFSFVLKLLCAEVWILKGPQSMLEFDKKKLVNVSHDKRKKYNTHAGNKSQIPSLLCCFYQKIDVDVKKCCMSRIHPELTLHAGRAEEVENLADA